MQGPERNRRRAFILQQDRLHLWLWAHHLPGLHCLQRKPNHGPHSPRGSGLWVNQGPMWPLRRTVAGWAVSMTVLINRNRKLSPKLARTENSLREWSSKYPYKKICRHIHAALTLVLTSWDEAGHDQVQGKRAGPSIRQHPMLTAHVTHYLMFRSLFKQLLTDFVSN